MGYVRDKAAQPVAGVGLFLYPEPGLRAVTDVKSARDGSYSFDSILPGQYVLVAGSPEIGVGSAGAFAAPLAVTPAYELKLDVVLDHETTYSAEGQIIYSGVGPRPEAVKLTVGFRAPPRGMQLAAPDAESRIVYNAGSGAFELPGLLPGIYRITASIANSDPRSCGGVDVTISNANQTGLVLPVSSDCIEGKR